MDPNCTELGLLRKDQDTDTQRDEHVRTQAGVRLHGPGEGPREEPPCPHLDPGLQASGEPTCLLFKHTWCFVWQPQQTRRLDQSLLAL